MKRSLSIMLLALFLFNVGGYNIMVVAVRFHSDKVLTEKIDSETYQKEHTIELKIPVNMPYPSLHERGFERIKGKFEYKGEQYKLIKHRIENNIVYIVCIKDVEQKRIERTITDYANSTSGDDSKALNLISKFLKEYHNPIEITLASPLKAISLKAFGNLAEETLNRSISITSPPPEA